MVSSGSHDPDFDPVLWVPIQELVIDEDLQIKSPTLLLFRTLLIEIVIQIRSDIIIIFIKYSCCLSEKVIE